VKRGFDVGVAFVALVALAPLLGIIGLLVRIKLGSPVLFCQARPGRRGRIFTLWKFRTMTDARDARGLLRPDAERMTPFGRWLRASSLDELPELLNVLRGEMSLVGPRPLLVEYLGRYSAEQARRHEIRPDRGEGLQDEGPLEHPGMGKEESRGFQREIVIVEQVEIHGAGRVDRTHLGTSEGAFDRLGRAEEFERCEVGLDLDDRIVKRPRSLRAIDRLRFENR
jgi:hypothetical protein